MNNCKYYDNGGCNGQKLQPACMGKCVNYVIDNGLTVSDVIADIIRIGNAQTGFMPALFDKVVYLDIDGIKTPLKSLKIDLNGGDLIFYGKEV